MSCLIIKPELQIVRVWKFVVWKMHKIETLRTAIDGSLVSVYQPLNCNKNKNIFSFFYWKQKQNNEKTKPLFHKEFFSRTINVNMNMEVGMLKRAHSAICWMKVYYRHVRMKELNNRETTTYFHKWYESTWLHIQ